MECFFPKCAPKELLDPNKDTIFIMELYKLHKIGRKSTRSSLGSKTQTLYFWNNYSKLTLKNYLKIKKTLKGFCNMICDILGKFRKRI